MAQLKNSIEDLEEPSGFRSFHQQQLNTLLDHWSAMSFYDHDFDTDIIDPR